MAIAWRIERTSVGDVELEYQAGGSGPPLLLLQGIDDGFEILPYHEKLAASCSVFLPSLPGFGRSPLPQWMDNAEDLVYLMLDAITRLCSGRVHLLGTGFGGWIAAEMAVRGQDNIGRLVLVDAYGIKTSEPWVRDIADLFVMNYDELLRATWHDPANANEVKAPGAPGLSREELVEALRRRQTAHLLGWNPFMHNPKLKRRLARIENPTLVVWGESDRVVSPEYGRAYHEAIPGSRLQMISAAGHYPYLERPEEFARVVTEFLKG